MHVHTLSIPLSVDIGLLPCLGYCKWCCSEHGVHVSLWFSLNLCPGVASQVALVVKNPPACSRDIRDRGLIYGLERSPGGGHGNALQYSCLEDPMDRGGWQAAVHGVAKRWAWLKWLNMHIGTHVCPGVGLLDHMVALSKFFKESPYCSP